MAGRARRKRIASFVAWVRDKPSGFAVRARKSQLVRGR